MKVYAVWDTSKGDLVKVDGRVLYGVDGPLLEYLGSGSEWIDPSTLEVWGWEWDTPGYMPPIPVEDSRYQVELPDL